MEMYGNVAYNCALENITDFLVERKTESEMATSHELSMKVNFKELGWNRLNFFVLQYEMSRLPCIAERK